MIKVNLLKNRAEGAGTQVTSATQIDNLTAVEGVSEGMDAEQARQIALKFVVIIVATAGLWVYETWHIDTLREQRRSIERQNGDMQKEISEKQPVAAKAKELQKKITDLRGRIKIIRDLSKTRLREIKSIDYIQNVIPDKVWLTNIEIKDEKVKIEGSAMSDEQLNRFIELIDGKSYFKDVVLLRAVEQKVKEGTIKNFEISSSLKAAE